MNGKPLGTDDLQINGSLWWGQPTMYYEDDKGKQKEVDNDLLMAGGGVMYRPDWGLLVSGECHWREVKIASLEKKLQGGIEAGSFKNPSPAVYDSLSAFVLAGFNFKHYFGVAVEPLIRFDYFDPNTKNKTKQTANLFGFSDSAHDAIWYLTGGVNYYIEGLHAVLRLNYIHKDEAWTHVVNVKGDLNSKDEGTQTGINNDELKFQAQVSF